MATVDPKDLLAAGGHFGHKTSRWHPKMAPYIYGQRNSTHIIDLTQTVELFDEALVFIEEVVAGGEDIMLVGTKRQARELVRDTAESTGMPYVVERWMGGMLTNFSTMSKRISYLKKLEKQFESGEMEAKYNKLEILRFEEEVEKLNTMFGGIKEMSKMPGAVFIVDVHEEDNAVKEANRLDIPAVAICDTNADPTRVDYVIPANDDAIKTLELLLGHVKTAIEKGKAKQKTEAATTKEEK